MRSFCAALVALIGSAACFPADVALEEARLDETRPAQELPSRSMAHLPASALQMEMRAFVDEAMTEGRVDEARHVLEQLVQTATPSRIRSDAVLELATLLEMAGDAQSARALRLHHRTIGPPHAPLEDELAMTSEASGNPEEALEHWRAATRADARHLRGWLGMARVLDALGRREEARDALLRYEREVHALRVLIEESSAGDERFRWLAAFDLGVREPEASRALGQLARTPEHRLRQEALRLLARNGHPRSIPVLEAMRAEESDEEIRGLLDDALEAIRRSGTSGR